MKYLVVRQSDGLVINAVVWDGVSPYNVDGCDLMLLSDQPVGVWIGWSYIGGEWVAPVVEDQ